jgi:OFA family oxalate/formate antiporter-like MFS transporter
MVAISQLWCDRRNWTGLQLHCASRGPVKGFPDRRGVITGGVALGGFGAGALVTAPVATRLIQSVGVLSTFAYLGIGLLIVTVVAGYFIKNPPQGWTPKGWAPTALQASQRSGHDYTLREALGTWQRWALWLLLFLNTSAGISVISQEVPLFQGLADVNAAVQMELDDFAGVLLQEIMLPEGVWRLSPSWA